MQEWIVLDTWENGLCSHALPAPTHEWQTTTVVFGIVMVQSSCQGWVWSATPGTIIHSNCHSVNIMVAPRSLTDYVLLHTTKWDKRSRPAQ